MNIFKSKPAVTAGDVSPEYIYICLSEKVNSARKLKFHTED